MPAFLNVEGNPAPIPSSVTAVYHSGYASIFTFDRSNDMHESFLPAMSDSWQTQAGLPRRVAFAADGCPPALDAGPAERRDHVVGG